MAGMKGIPRRNGTSETSAPGPSDEAPPPDAESPTDSAEPDSTRQEPSGVPAPGEENSENEGDDDPLTEIPGSADEPQEDVGSEGFSVEEAQLSPGERVGEGMGTIALERVPGDRLASEPGRPLFPGALAGELSQMSDSEIMQRAGAGDDACFEFLAVKYRRPIISFMYRMVHNQAVAEELAQEVFLRVYRARASYRAEARFTTWLYRIAANMAINHARDTKHERSSASVYLDQTDETTGITPDVADLRPLAEQEMLHDERMRRIRQHVAALPERQRMAVVMHKYQDLDYKQIGAVLKLSESATKSLLFRAYQTLRDRLKEFA